MWEQRIGLFCLFSFGHTHARSYSSPARDWTHALSNEGGGPNHWTTRELLTTGVWWENVFTWVIWYSWLPVLLLDNPGQFPTLESSHRDKVPVVQAWESWVCLWLSNFTGITCNWLLWKYLHYGNWQTLYCLLTAKSDWAPFTSTWLGSFHPLGWVSLPSLVSPWLTLSQGTGKILSSGF